MTARTEQHAPAPANNITRRGQQGGAEEAQP